MKPTDEEIVEAVIVMAEVIPHFNRTLLFKEVVHANLKSLVGEKEALDWLVTTACRQMRAFNIPDLCGLYCSRFAPADGSEPTRCDIPGFTPAEAADKAEMAYIMSETGEHFRKMLAWKEEWKREQKLIGGSTEPDSEESKRFIEGVVAELPPMPHPKVADLVEGADAARRLADTIGNPATRVENPTVAELNKAADELTARRPSSWAGHEESDKAALENEAWYRRLKRSLA